MSENAFAGLRDILSNNIASAPSQSYTREDFVRDLEAFAEKLRSDEYAEQERTRYLAMMAGEQLIEHALAQGIITEAEYWRLLESIGINGCLIVSPSMSSRLAQVREQG